MGMIRIMLMIMIRIMMIKIMMIMRRDCENWIGWDDAVEAEAG